MAVKRATTRRDIKEATPEEYPGQTRLVSPTGAESIVPDSIVEALIESGYQRK